MSLPLRLVHMETLPFSAILANCPSVESGSGQLHSFLMILTLLDSRQLTSEDFFCSEWTDFV